MDDIIVRMNANRSFEAHYIELQSICTRLIDSAKNLETLLISVILCVFRMISKLYLIELNMKISGKFPAAIGFTAKGFNTHGSVQTHNDRI